MHAPAAARRRTGLVLPGLAALVAFAILLALGTWQLRRLAWKEALLDRIHERMGAAPQPLPPEADWPSLRPDRYEYRRVTATGNFEYDKDALVFRPEGVGRAGGKGPGYLVMTPLRLASGAYVIVDRGFVPMTESDPASRAASRIPGETTVVSPMRAAESRGLFTPADDPGKNQWFTRDPKAIAARFGLERTAPFTIDAEDAPVRGGWPIGGQTVVAIPNNHLGYAITWYGLAAALAGTFLVYALGRPRRDTV